MNSDAAIYMAEGDQYMLAAEWHKAAAAYRRALDLVPGNLGLLNLWLRPVGFQPLNLGDCSFPRPPAEELKPYLLELVSETTPSKVFERLVYLAKYKEAKQLAEAMPPWLISDPHAFISYLDCLTGLEEFQELDRVCLAHRSLALKSGDAVQLWLYALSVMHKSEEYYQLVIEASTQATWNEENVFNALLCADQCPENLKQDGVKMMAMIEALYRESPTQERVNTLMEVFRELLRSDVIQDGVLAGKFVCGVLGNYLIAPEILCKVGNRLRKHGDAKRGDDYLWRALYRVSSQTGMRNSDDDEYYCYFELAEEAARLDDKGLAVNLLDQHQKWSWANGTDDFFKHGGLCEKIGRYEDAVRFYRLGSSDESEDAVCRLCPNAPVSLCRAEQEEEARERGEADVEDSYVGMPCFLADSPKAAAASIRRGAPSDTALLKRLVFRLLDKGKVSEALWLTQGGMDKNPEDKSLQDVLHLVERKTATSTRFSK